jgi:hypothetical protein
MKLLGPQSKCRCFGIKSIKHTQDIDIKPISCKTAIVRSPNIITVIKSRGLNVGGM